MLKSKTSVFKIKKSGLKNVSVKKYPHLTCHKMYKIFKGKL